MSCNAYTNIAIETDWKLIFEDNPETQFRVAENIRKRLIIRKRKIQDYEAGHPQGLQETVEQCDCILHFWNKYIYKHIYIYQGNIPS